jgi:predicted ribosomally synthesized peptide with SipW-like signal peptide
MSGIGTWAFFSDVETSSQNTFAAGTLDLKTNDADGVTQTLLAANMNPGDSIGPVTIILKNTGTLNASSLDLAFTYVDDDDTNNPIDKSADETAALIELITLKYDGYNLLGAVQDNNTNGYRDIQDLKNTDLSGQNGINASSTKDFEIGIKARTSVDSQFQADGINITMTFTLNQ